MRLKLKTPTVLLMLSCVIAGIFVEKFYSYDQSVVLVDPEINFDVCFTPPIGCSNVLVQYINNAKESIFIQAYGFTSKRIIDAIINAKGRGLAFLFYLIEVI